MASQSISTPSAPAAQAPVLPSPWRRALTVVVLLYAAGVLLLWGWMRLQGDEHWLATLVLFGPRWLCALPLLVLVPLAGWAHRRLLAVLALVGCWIVGPLMGFELHLPASSTGLDQVRVMTCNVDQDVFDPQRLADAIAAEQPDIVALQEVCPGTPFIWPASWSVAQRDEFVVASRYPVTREEAVRRPGKLSETAVRFVVRMPDRQVQIFNVHQETPRWGIEAVLNSRTGLDWSKAPEMEALVRYRDQESRTTSQWVARFGGNQIVLGDFNTPADSVIFRRWWSPWTNCFSRTGNGLGFSKNSEKHGWSYGSRIDHVLCNDDWRPVGCWVGPDIGSDHLPVVADLQWIGDRVPADR